MLIKINCYGKMLTFFGGAARMVARLLATGVFTSFSTYHTLSVENLDYAALHQGYAVYTLIRQDGSPVACNRGFYQFSTYHTLSVENLDYAALHQGYAVYTLIRQDGSPVACNRGFYQFSTYHTLSVENLDYAALHQGYAFFLK